MAILNEMKTWEYHFMVFDKRGGGKLDNERQDISWIKMFKSDDYQWDTMKSRVKKLSLF